MRRVLVYACAVVCVIVALAWRGKPALAADIAKVEIVEVKAAANRPATRPVADPLSMRIKAVRLNVVPLSDALDYVKSLTGANMIVHWREFESSIIKRDEPVTLSLDDVSAARTLTEILREFGLDYYIEDGIVMVTTTEVVNSIMTVRFIDVRDLIIQSMKWDARVRAEHRRINGLPPDDPSNQGGNGGAAGGGIFPRGGNAIGRQPAVAEEFIRELLEMIEECVDPASWTDNGGRASCRYIGGRLVITQTAENHEKIIRLLDDLRATGE